MRKLLIITLLFQYSFFLSAQKNSKLFYGLSTSVDFGRFQDRVEILPIMGIKLFPKIYAGLGTNISFYSTENTVYSFTGNQSDKYKLNDNIWYYGSECFIRYQPFEKDKNFAKHMFLQSSYEYLHGNGKYKDKNETYRYNTDNHSILVGIGYKHPISDRLHLGMSINFKLNHESNSPYHNPIIHILLER